MQKQIKELGKVRVQSKVGSLFMQYIGYVLLLAVVGILVYNIAFAH